MNPRARTLTYTGVAISCAGFLLITLAWGLVAGKTEVSDQVVPLVGAGGGGFALVLAGLAVVATAAQRQDAHARQLLHDQLTRLGLEPDRPDELGQTQLVGRELAS
jgi:hypothetical protein